MIVFYHNNKKENHVSLGRGFLFSRK